MLTNLVFIKKRRILKFMASEDDYDVAAFMKIIFSNVKQDFSDN